MGGCTRDWKGADVNVKPGDMAVVSRGARLNEGRMCLVVGPGENRIGYWQWLIQPLQPWLNVDGESLMRLGWFPDAYLKRIDPLPDDEQTDEVKEREDTTVG
jgi:hypothetical protein